MRTFIAGVLALWAGAAQGATTGYDLYRALLLADDRYTLPGISVRK
jgi:hypothetical protein